MNNLKLLCTFNQIKISPVKATSVRNKLSDNMNGTHSATMISTETENDAKTYKKLHEIFRPFHAPGYKNGPIFSNILKQFDSIVLTTTPSSNKFELISK